MNLLVLTLVCFYIEIATSLYCYWNTGCPYKFFSSETPYNVIRGDIRDSIIDMEGCESISIWGLYRHGKNWPGKSIAKRMEEAVTIREYVESSFEKGNSSICAQDIEILRNWSFDNNIINRASELTDEGYQELLGLGRRLKQVYPKLLADLKEGSYTLHPAGGNAIENSVKAFIEGLEHENLSVEKGDDDDVLGTHSGCGKYHTELMETDYAETIKYFNNPDYLVAKDRIQRRTGIAYNLTNQDIAALYDLCRYAWSGIKNGPRPWCALFTTEDLKILEYVQDLTYYYRNGYGLPNSDTFGHSLMNNLLKTFKLAKNGQGKKITAYFMNAAMMNMVYTTLGLFKDDAILSGHRDPNRKWRTSKHTSFAVNLVAVLSRCTKGDAVDYNVVFYLNEEPLRSLCNEGVCTWQEFEEILTPFINTSTVCK